MWSWMFKEHFKSFQGLWLIKSRGLFLHACELQELQGWDLDHERNGKIPGKKREVEFIQSQTSKSWEEVSQARGQGHIVQTIRLLSRPIGGDTENTKKSGESPHHCPWSLPPSLICQVKFTCNLSAQVLNCFPNNLIGSTTRWTGSCFKTMLLYAAFRLGGWENERC